MTNYTKGPWELLTNFLCKEGQQDDYVKIIAPIVYNVDGEERCGFDIQGFVKPADAHLMVSAPDLYEALKVATAFLRDESEYCGSADGEIVMLHAPGRKKAVDTIIAQCEAAMKKAEGSDGGN